MFEFKATVNCDQNKVKKHVNNFKTGKACKLRFKRRNKCFSEKELLMQGQNLTLSQPLC